MVIWLLILVIIGLILFNILYYIPNKLKAQEEKLSLHFKEVHLRFNRLEEALKNKE